MSGFKDLLLSYLLNSVWQVPLLALTGIVAARLVRPAGPLAEHRVWVGTMLSQALLPGVSLMSWDWLHIAWPWHISAAAVKQASVSVQMGTGTGLGTVLLPSRLMTASAILYCSVVLYFAARFVWRCRRLAMLAHFTQPLDPGHDAVLACNSLCEQMGTRPIAVCSSVQIFSPLTMGFLRKRVLLPHGMLAGLSQPDMATAMAHEFAHVCRNDFLKNLLYELLSLPASYHPAFWLARQRMTETREMVCDQMAAELTGSSHPYAESLLRLASLLLQGKPLEVPHAIGVFDANTLERRLMKLTETTKPTGPIRRCAAIVTSLMLGIGVASAVVALRLDVASAAIDNTATQKSGPTSISPKEMQDRILDRVNPKYPPDAKKAHIQGKVVLDAIIGTTGHVENLKVVSGPSELQQSALDAVRQWTYRPVVIGGAPVEVETTINVIYSLAK